MILLVDKPAGITSQQAVSVIKRACGKKLKIGHTGTLDPMCTGLLPILTGCDTKLTQFFPHRKAYRAVLRFGLRTDTGDVSGNPLETSLLPTENEAFSLIARAVECTEQIPPMYSAVHLDGKRLYELAREGKTVDRPARPVEIFSVSETERLSECDYAFTVACSSGTYIRTLCEDIASFGGYCGTMASLCRVESNGFSLADARPLETVAEYAARGRLEEISVSAETAFSDLPSCAVPEDGKVYYQNGGTLTPGRFTPTAQPGLFRAYSAGGVFLGLGSCGNEGVKAVFRADLPGGEAESCLS